MTHQATLLVVDLRMVSSRHPSFKSNMLCGVCVFLVCTWWGRIGGCSVAAMSIDRPRRPAARTTSAVKGNLGSGSSSGGRGGARTKTWRNSRNKSGYALRASGIKTRAKSRKRPPRWEQEGDALYQPIVPAAITENDKENSVAPKTIDEAEKLLATLARPSSTPHPDGSIKGRDTTAMPSDDDDKSNENDDTGKRSPPANTLWGSLPVGPVLRSRLHQISYKEPTPIQEAAFSVLTSRNNAVLASPCGSGKSLAYLIPLLSASSRNPCQMMIVTPTIELALQLQQNVNELWPPRNGDASKSLMHVVGYNDRNNQITDSDGSLIKSPTIVLPPEDATIIAGTPRALRKFYSDIVKASSFDPEAMALKKTIRSNLKTIVLDEADRLLDTEGVVRASFERKNRDQPSRSPSGRNKSNCRQKAKLTQTDLLLSEIPCRSLRDLHIVCVSATVGRTLRRQLMELLQVSSIESAAVLVTGADDKRTKKNADRRKTSLMPATLTHQYHLLPPPASEEKTKEGNQNDILVAMWQIMQGLEVLAPILVFPGRLGVEKVQEFLTERNCFNVRTLSSSTDLWSLSNEANNEGQDRSTEDDPIHTIGETRIYIVPERFGRGLDLPGIRYAFLLNLPSTTAGYTHLSGRTGRNGREGTAITFVRPREAPKLIAIATALGLAFSAIDAKKGFSPEKEKVSDTVSGNDQMQHDTNVSDVESNKDSHTPCPWISLAESTLQRKTNAQLTSYLESYVSD